ncbi:MAG: hypothetical protein GC159_18915 [Phycisphaera sp.]|nr:hypothetical protein [Phycisphaera sp.]
MTDKTTANGGFSRRRLDRSKLDWTVILGIGFMHVGALLAFWPAMFTWTGLAICAFFVWVTACLGITLGFHRLLTHRGFKTPKWVEYFLTLCGCLTWQGSPVQWVGVHRIHHKHSDEEEDPHTPKHGFSWAHMFWCMQLESEGRRGVDAAKDLLRDPGHRVLHEWFWLPQFILAGLLYAGGAWAQSAGWSASGWSWVIWGIFVRTTVVYHGTWFVNSAAHTWGYRNYDTKEHSTNLWWVAIWSFGEGWHNNHHAYQRSARHGLRWFELDPTYWVIVLMKWTGLARDIVLPKPEEMPKAVKEAAKAAAAAAKAAKEAAEQGDEVVASLVMPRDNSVA